MLGYLAITDGPCDEAISALSREVQGALVAKVAPTAFLYYFPNEYGAHMPGLEVLKRFEIIIAEISKEFEVCSLKPKYMDAIAAFNRERANAAAAEGQVPM